MTQDSFQASSQEIANQIEVRRLSPAGRLTVDQINEAFQPIGFDLVKKDDLFHRRINHPFIRPDFKIASPHRVDPGEVLEARLKQLIKQFEAFTNWQNTILSFVTTESTGYKVFDDIKSGVSLIRSGSDMVLEGFETIRRNEIGDRPNPMVSLVSLISNHCRVRGKQPSQSKAIKAALALANMILPPRARRSGWLAPMTESAVKKAMDRHRRRTRDN